MKGTVSQIKDLGPGLLDFMPFLLGNSDCFANAIA